MLHHISLGARHIENAARFYDAALAPFGYVRVWSDLRPGEQGQAVGYGLEGSDDKLTIKQVGGLVPDIPAGGRDNGAPGLRLDYGENYFAAFVIDPEGHRLEAVCKSR